MKHISLTVVRMADSERPLGSRLLVGYLESRASSAAWILDRTPVSFEISCPGKAARSTQSQLDEGHCRGILRSNFHAFACSVPLHAHTADLVASSIKKR